METRDNDSFNEIFLREFICMLEWFLCNEHKGNCWKLINRSVYNCPYWIPQNSFKVSHENLVIQYINKISASFSCFRLCFQLLSLTIYWCYNDKIVANTQICFCSDLKGYIYWVSVNKNTDLQGWTNHY